MDPVQQDQSQVMTQSNPLTFVQFAKPETNIIKQYIALEFDIG